MEGSFITSIPRHRRLAMIVVVEIIFEKIDNTFLKNKRRAIIRDQIKYLGLSESECDKHINTVDFNLLKAYFTALNRKERQVLVMLVLELVGCDKTASINDFGVASLITEKLTGISEKEFAAYFSEIDSINRHFIQPNTPSTNNHVSESNVGGAIILVILTLAVVGLVSLCSNK